MTRLAVLLLIVLIALVGTLVVLWASARRPGAARPSSALVSGLVAGSILSLGGIVFLLAQPVPVQRDVDPGGSQLTRPEDSVDEARGAEETAAASARIPAMFQGSWAPDSLACDATGETARIDIGPSQIEFYESTGRLEQLTPLSGGREHALTLAFTGEGQTWTRTLILRRVGHELSFREEGQSDRLYIRC